MNIILTNLSNILLTLLTTLIGYISIIIKKNKRSITHDIKMRSIFKLKKKELEENYYDTQIIFGRYKHKEV